MPGLMDYVVPPQCYQKFFHEHNFEVDCLKIVMSKLLGYAVILGSTMVKLPQILKIVKAGSAEGISLIGVVLELVATTGTLAYSFANGFPFSSYGESTFMTFQQAIILFLLLLYTRGTTSALMSSAVYSGILAFLLSPGTPMKFLTILQASVVALMIISRLTQASTNFTNKSTGQLSLITVLLQFLGAAVRILTSLQETGDKMSILMYTMSTITNGLLLLQVIIYWDSNSRPPLNSTNNAKKSVKKIN